MHESHQPLVIGMSSLPFFDIAAWTRAIICHLVHENPIQQQPIRNSTSSFVLNRNKRDGMTSNSSIDLQQ